MAATRPAPRPTRPTAKRVTCACLSALVLRKPSAKAAPPTTPAAVAAAAAAERSPEVELTYNWDPEVYFNRQQIVLYDKFTQFTLLAAREAVEQSGLVFEGQLGLRSGVVLGTAAGGMNTWDENYRTVYEEGKNRVHPFVVPKLMNNAATSHVSLEYGLLGPSFTVATACASSNHAMGMAFNMVRSGAATVMLTGGSEAMLCFGGVKAWEGLRVLAPDLARGKVVVASYFAKNILPVLASTKEILGSLDNESMELEEDAF